MPKCPAKAIARFFRRTLVLRRISLHEFPCRVRVSHCPLNLPPPEQRFSPLLPIRFDIAESGSPQPTELFCQRNKNQVQIEKTAAGLFELKHFSIDGLDDTGNTNVV